MIEGPLGGFLGVRLGRRPIGLMPEGRALSDQPRQILGAEVVERALPLDALFNLLDVGDDTLVDDLLVALFFRASMASRSAFTASRIAARATSLLLNIDVSSNSARGEDCPLSGGHGPYWDNSKGR